jgi:hypothetical protein
MKIFLKVGSNQAIDDLLTGLEKENYIKRDGKMRGIIVTDKGLESKDKFILQTDNNPISSLPLTYSGNISTSENKQKPFFQVTGVNGFSFIPVNLSKRGGEDDVNTTN